MSDDPSAALAAQGVNWFVRKVLARAPISLSVSQTRDPSSDVQTYTAVQTSMGRVAEEKRILNWEEIAQHHVVFGEIKTKARLVPVSEVAVSCLRDGWEDGTDVVIEVQARGSGWTSWQAWGFEVLNGERHHVRRAVLGKGSDFSPGVSPGSIVVRMVYDWAGAE